MRTNRNEQIEKIDLRRNKNWKIERSQRMQTKISTGNGRLENFRNKKEPQKTGTENTATGDAVQQGSGTCTSPSCRIIPTR